jgi:hypothetical protein
MLPVPFCALVNALLLRPPRGLLPPVHSRTYAWLAGGAAGLLLGLLIWRRTRRRPPPPPPLPPATLARQSLAALQHLPETDALVAEVSHIVRRYVRSVIGRANEELTTEELLAAVETRQATNPNARQPLREFLHGCDAARFAPAPPAPPVALVSQALRLITRFESVGPAQAEPSPEIASESSR